jgi:hypothetical protein
MLQLTCKDAGARSNPSHRPIRGRISIEQVLLLAVLDSLGEENAEGV